MSEQIGDPLLLDLIKAIQVFDRERVAAMIDAFIATTGSVAATNGEILWSLTGVLVAMIRSDPAEKMDALAVVQRMITLRMTWGEHIDATSRPSAVEEMPGAC